MDLGWEDSVAIGMVQRSTSEIRIIDYIEDSHKTLAEYTAMLRERPYHWGKVYLPWDGYAKKVDTGKSSEDVMRKLGWDVATREESVFLGVEEGIKTVRLTFPRIYIDKERCARLIECIKRYRRSVNRTTGAPGGPVHDEFCLPAGEKVLIEGGYKSVEDVVIGDVVVLPGGLSGKVTRAGVTRYTKELCEIEGVNGERLRLTPNHTVLTSDGPTIAAALRCGSIVFRHNEGKRSGLWGALKSFLMAGRIGLMDAITLATTSGRPHQGPYTEMCGSITTDLGSGKQDSPKKRFVLFAVKRIIHFLRKDQSSVTRIAKLRRYAVAEQPVYNITVEGHHCYIAGGFLVGNSHGSDMLRYLCLNVDNMHNHSSAQHDMYHRQVFEVEYEETY